jgi:hypothetical protein
VGQRKESSGANAPPVHGIKKYLAIFNNYFNNSSKSESKHSLKIAM